MEKPKKITFICAEEYNAKKHLQDAWSPTQSQRQSQNPDEDGNSSSDTLSVQSAGSGCEDPKPDLDSSRKKGMPKKLNLDLQLLANQSNSQATMYNVLFYTNRIPSVPDGDLIERIHEKWRGDYDKLEIHHGYVQWLFPNFYKSRFNDESFELRPEEAHFFRHNLRVAERLVKSYILMLDFLGIAITNLKSGELSRNTNYKQRFRKTFIENRHNLMRVTRILANMSVTGFRLYAVKLVEFLEVQIFGKVGGFASAKSQEKATDLILDCPLSELAASKIICEWDEFGQIDDKKEGELQRLQFACKCQHLSPPPFEPSIFFLQKANQ